MQPLNPDAEWVLRERMDSQVEFPRTDDIKALLDLAGHPFADALDAAKRLPRLAFRFGIPKIRSGDEHKALAIARQVK
jgi:hypothetical protein